MKPQPQPPKTYSLDWPPSVNHYWGSRVAERVVNGQVAQFVHVYRTKRANEYRDSVAIAVYTQGPVIFDGPVVVTLELHQPDKLRRDIDNVPKGIFDSLTAAQVWGDDSQVHAMLIAWGKTESPGSVTVTIRPFRKVMLRRIMDSFQRWWSEPSDEKEQLEMF